jgi:hypothetical protein
MENSSPPRRHRLAWLALATVVTLLVLPATRYLLKTQMQMEALTYSTATNLPAERLAAARMPDDYPVQLALAAEYPSAVAEAPPADPGAPAKARNHRVGALAQRFPNNPSVYANFLRFMTQGEVRVSRNDDGTVPVPPAGVTVVPTAPESLEMFDTAAQKGMELDPDNAYFPMMRAIVLFNTHRDSEALDSLKAASRCSHWAEYYQDEADGRNRLQAATYGEEGALQHLNVAANLLFPQYASLRAVARLAVHLAGDAESDGNTAEGVAIRHALMRCGGLMRSQGTSYITSLVGISIANIGAANPYGIQNHDSLSAGHATEAEAAKRREKRRELYYSYLESIGQPQEAAWAKTEIAAADQAKTVGAEAMHYSVFDGRKLYQLGVSWLVNNALLSGALILLMLGAAAQLASHVRPRKAVLVWRFVFALLVVSGIGLWQWQATRVGMKPYIEMQNMFSNLQSSGNDFDDSANAAAVERLATGLGLLVPTLLVGLIAALSLFQRVPMSTGLGRGLRGVAIPVAAVLFLVYAISLLPTAQIESTVKTEMARVTHDEPHYLAELSGKTWPGDPQP